MGRVMMLGLGMILPTVAMAGVDQWTPETWIGYLTKFGLTGALGAVVIAEAFALVWTVKKLLARDGRSVELAEKVAAAMQANSAASERHSASLDRFATVIEKCKVKND